jgi:ribonucleoside-diphosphate reductase alpha chain
MKITKIIPKKPVLTVDIEVENTSTYQLSNGCVSHNTSSLVLGTSSGIHSWFAPFYVRRIRVGKNEAIYKYLKANHPNLVEDEFFKPHLQAVISVPIKAPDGAICSSESSLELLERIKKFNIEWIRPGHIKGDNFNNVSATVYVKRDEWDTVGKWLYENREFYNGITVLPSDVFSYPQMPFERITEDQYNSMVKDLAEIDLTKVVEEEDLTNLASEAACSGGSCELK